MSDFYDYTPFDEMKKIVDTSNPLFSPVDTSGMVPNSFYDETPTMGNQTNIATFVNNYGKQISALAAQSNDPDAYEKLLVSAFVADRIGSTTEAVFNDYDAATEKYFGSTMPYKTAYGAIVDAFNMGVISQKQAIAMFKRMMGDESPYLSQYIKDLEASKPALDSIKRNPVVGVMKSAANLGASMWEAWKFSLPAMAAGAAASTPTALAASAAGPGAALAQLAAGTARGLSYGASAYTGMAEAGSLALTLSTQFEKAGIPEETYMPIIRAVAMPVGVINAAIEQLGFKYTPGISTLLKAAEGDIMKAVRAKVASGALAKVTTSQVLAAMKYGAVQGAKTTAEDFVGNIVEETLQQASTDIGEIAGQALMQYHLDKAGIDQQVDRKTLEGVVADLRDTITETAKAMLVMAPASGAVSSVANASAAAKMMKTMVDSEAQKYGVAAEVSKLQAQTAQQPEAKPKTFKGDTMHAPTGELKYEIRNTATSSDGVTSYMLVPDENGERLAHLKFTVEDAKVVIDEAEAPTQELKLDMIRTLSAMPTVAGLEIEWNPQTEEDLALKEELVNEEGTIQSYAEADPMAPVFDRIKTTFKNAAALTDEDANVAAIFAQGAAAARGESLDDFIAQNFLPDVAVAGLPFDPVTQKQAQDLRAQGKTPVGAAGFMVNNQWVPGSEITRIAEKAQVLLHLTQRGDLSDFIHEFSHGLVGIGLTEQQQKIAESIVGKPVAEWQAAEHEAFAQAIEAQVPYIVNKAREVKDNEQVGLLRTMARAVLDTIWNLLTVGMKKPKNEAQKFIDTMFGAPVSKVVGKQGGQQSAQPATLNKVEGLYHGTPHEIVGGFKLSRAGTGEGGSVYGYGAYLTANRDVAESYAKQLTAPKYFVTGEHNIATDTLASAGNMKYVSNLTEDQAWEKLRGWYPKTFTMSREEFGAFWSDLTLLKNRRLYDMAIEDPRGERFLDLDAKVPEDQLELVLNKIGITKEQALAEKRDWWVIPDESGRLAATLRDFFRSHMTGNDLYMALDIGFGADKQKASEILDSAGFTGNTYIGDFKKSGDKGARNYVVFNEQYLKTGEATLLKTDTPEFKKWFGDWTDPQAFTAKAKGPVSFAVDKEGKPLVLYHSTVNDFEAFEVGRPSKNSWAFGDYETTRYAIFATPNPDFSASYAGKKVGARTMPVYMSMKSPIDLTREGAWWDIADEMDADGYNGNFVRNGVQYLWELFDDKGFVEWAMSKGYDGAIFEENDDNSEPQITYAVFSPEQVKSIYNRGTFNPVDPRILFKTTDTPEFKKWFGDSKAVDESGKPLVVYHGTTHKDITTFLPMGDNGGEEKAQQALDNFRKAQSQNQPFGYMNFRSGTFFSPDPEYAGNYTRDNTGVMYPVYIKAENPIYIDQKTGKVSIERSNKTADALFMMDGGKINEIAVIDPTQIKSIYNRGTFDPVDPRILFKTTETPEFKKWFRGSKVVDANGQPKVMYHGTKATVKQTNKEPYSTTSTKTFDVFRTNRELGAHFGTVEQANDILALDSYVMGDMRKDPPRIYPVFIDIKNPLRLRDMGSFSVKYVLPQLRDLNVITRDKYNEIRGLYEQGTFYTAQAEAAETAVQNAIRSAGYDGVVYLNRREAIGDGIDDYTSYELNDYSDEEFLEHFPDARDSYIVFYSDQVKSATGNNGAFDPMNPSILFKSVDKDGNDLRTLEMGTRNPTAKKATESATDRNTMSGLAPIMSDEGLVQKAAAAIRTYPGFRDVGASDQQVIEKFINDAVDNLVFMHDLLPEQERKTARKWYDAAHNLAQKWSRKYNLSLSQVAGVIATLSPSTDWNVNLSLAERMFDIWQNGQDLVWTEEMTKAITPVYKENGKLLTGYEKFFDETYKPITERVMTKRFGDLETDVERAIFMRAYAHGHQSVEYRIFSPEGYWGDKPVNNDGSFTKMAWQIFDCMGKAFAIIRLGDRETISAGIGLQHKVRNFYNNIVNPNSDLMHVTIDTHAVGAALIRAMSQISREVLHNFGGKNPGDLGVGSSSILGVTGLYGIYQEAYIRAAKKLGIMPRQLQSIVWEAIRVLFTAKGKTAKIKAEVDAIWDRYGRGEIDGEEARRSVVERVGGFGLPDWAEPSDRRNGEVWDSSYKEELLRTGVPRWVQPEPGISNPEDIRDSGGSIGVTIQPQSLLKVVDTAKLEDKVGVTGGARPGRFESKGYSPVLHPEHPTDLGLVREKLIATLGSEEVQSFIKEKFGATLPDRFLHRGSWQGEPEPSYTLQGADLSNEQAQKLASLIGMMTSQESVVAWDILTGGDQFTFPVVYAVDDSPMNKDRQDQVAEAFRKAGLDYSGTIDKTGFKVLVFGDDEASTAKNLEETLAKVKQIAAENDIGEVKAASASSALVEAGGYKANLGVLWGADDGTGSSAGFRRAVDLIFVPYMEALFEQGYGFSADNFQALFGLSDEDFQYVERAALEAADRVASRIKSDPTFMAASQPEVSIGGIDETLKGIWQKAVADEKFSAGLDPAVLQAAKALGTGKPLSDKLRSALEEAIRNDPMVLEPEQATVALPEGSEDYSITERIRLAQNVSDPELAEKIESGEVTEEDILARSRFLVAKIRDIQNRLKMTKAQQESVYAELSDEERLAYGLKDRIAFAERELDSRQRRVEAALNAGRVDQKLVDLRLKTLNRLNDLKGQYEALSPEVRAVIDSPEMDALSELQTTAKDRIAREKRLAYGKTQATVAELKKEYRDAEAQRRVMRKIRELREKVAKQVSKMPKSVDFSYTEPMRIIARAVAGNTITQAEWDAFKQFVDDNGMGYMFDRVTMTTLQKVKPSKWSIAELESVYDRIRLMKRFGRAKRTTYLEIEKNLRESERERAISTILRGKDLVLASGEPKDSTIFVKALLEAGKPDRIALIMDGGKPGIFTQWLQDEVNRSWNETMRQTDARTEPVIAKLDELKLTLNPFDVRPGFTYLGREIDVKGYRYDNGKRPTVQDVMFWYIGRRNEKTAKALLVGNQIPAAVLDASIDVLSAQEKALAELIAKDFSVNFERLRQAFVKQFNVDLPGEAWYVPMKRRDVSYGARSEEIAADLVGRAGLQKQFMDRGFTYARIELGDKYQTPIRTDLMNLWMAAVQKQEAFIAQDLTVKRLHGIFEDLDVKRAIQQAYGPEMNRWVAKYINDIARPDIYAAQTGTDRLTASLRSGLAVSYMGFNILSGAKQLVSVMPFLADAGPVHIVSAAGQWLTAKRSLDKQGRAIPKLENGLIQFVEERSELVKHRSISREFEELKRLDATAYQQVVKKIGTTSMHHLEAIDKASIVIGWKAVYDRYVKTVGEAEAAKLADKAVVRGQPSGRVQDLAQMYRSGEAAKWLVMFTNAVNSLLNIVAIDVPMALKDGRVGHAVADITAIILTGVGISLAAGALHGDDDEEKKRRIRQGVWSQFTDMIPFVGTAITAMLSGRPVREGISFMPALEPAGKTFQHVTEKEYNDAVADGLEALGYALKLPVSGPKRVFKAISSGDPTEVLGWR